MAASSAHAALYLPPGFRQSVRLAAGGLEAVLITSPERADRFSYDSVDGGNSGAILGAGDTVDLDLPVAAGSELRYSLSCEDGLDVGVVVWVLRATAAAQTTDEVQPWLRATELDGARSFDEDVRVVMRLDNSYSWFYSKTIHLLVELLCPRPALPPPDTALLQSEEMALRAQWLAQLDGEEARLERRVADAMNPDQQAVEARRAEEKLEKRMKKLGIS